MKRYEKITPEGTRDLLFEDCMVRREIEHKLSRCFSLSGYNEVITPGLEFYDVFTGETTYFPQESLYKTTDLKGRILVLRPDLTAPIARLAATRLQHESKPLRLYYRQNIYRINQNLNGRSDEIGQMGIELIGSDSIRADLEALATAAYAMNEVGEGSCTIEIGHIGIFKALTQDLPIDEERREDIRQLIESKNYAALNDLLDELGDCKQAKALKQLPRMFGGAEIFEQAKRLFDNEKIGEILSYLQSLYEALKQLPIAADITVDLGMVNGIHYYTGLIFKGYLTGSGDTVLSGGRYDKLLADFGADLPATGFGMDIDAVAKVYRTRHPISLGPAEMLVHGCPGYEMQALIALEGETAKGHRCENSLCETVEQAKEYCQNKGIAKLLVIGETNELLLIE